MLHLPSSLMEDVKALAARDAVSVNQFLVQAAVEKVIALKARGHLAERAARATLGDLGATSPFAQNRTLSRKGRGKSGSCTNESLRTGCRSHAKFGNFRCKTLFQNPAER